MKYFTHLFQQLSISLSKEDSIKYLVNYWNSCAEEENKTYALKFFLSFSLKRKVTTKQLKEWAPQITGLPEWLIERSEEETGNFIQAFALLLRQKGKGFNLPLAEWLLKVSNVNAKNESEIRELIQNISNAPQYDRILLLRLITGTFRSPIHPNTVIKSLAEFLKITSQKINLRLFKVDLANLTTLDILKNPIPYEDNFVPYALPKIEVLENELSDLLDSTIGWSVFGKKEGITAQIVKYKESAYIWSVEGEILNDKFPEIIRALDQVSNNVTVLGQILPKNPSQSVEKLYDRLNKKNISNKELLECPANFEIWEVLDFDEDFEELCRKTGFISAEWISIENPDQLNEMHKNCRKLGFSGLLLQSIERRNQLFYRKASCYSIKAILTYVELDNLSNTGLKSLSFGVLNDHSEIIPIAKTEVFDDHIEVSEIVEFTKQNTMERFGPVRTVTPELVFELHFDSIAPSKRRKSGLIISNVSVFKKIEVATDSSDTLEAIRKLLN